MSAVAHTAAAALLRAAASSSLRAPAEAAATLAAASTAAAAAAGPFSSSSSRSYSSSSSGSTHRSPPGLLEVREYTLHPRGAKDFMALAAETAALRRELLPFLGLFTCDAGGDLNKVTHLYAYADLAQRAEVRARAAKDARWQAFIDASRPHVAAQRSTIFAEDGAVYDALGQGGAAGFRTPARGGTGAAATAAPVYELREYQLVAGYQAVPALVATFAAALPDKVAADREGLLVALAHSDIGTLNRVIELWRYPSAAASVRARVASRGVQRWRDAIASVAPSVVSFNTSLLVPAPFSPWQ